MLIMIIIKIIFFYRNTIQFTPTQIEAIRAGMQPGLTMVRTLILCSIVLYCVVFF